MSGKKKMGARRPLLAKGEILNEPVEKPKSGGPKFDPWTAQEAHEKLSPYAERLQVGLSGLGDELCGEHIIFEGTLHPNYVAGSYFPATVLDRSNLYVVGSRSARSDKIMKKTVHKNELTKTLLIAGTREGINRFADQVRTEPSNRTEVIWKDLIKFNRLQLPRTGDILVHNPIDKDPSSKITWEVVISPLYADKGEFHNELIDDAFRKFVQWIERLGGEVDVSYRRLVKDLTFVPILLTQEKIREAARFNLLRSIRPMPKLRPIDTMSTRSRKKRMDAPDLEKGAAKLSTTPVAIFDGGIVPEIPQLSKFVKEIDLTDAPKDAAFVDHGCIVTSSFLFGCINPQVRKLSTPFSPIDHYRVFPAKTSGKFDDEIYWILDRIKEVLSTGKYKIVNLSIGPDIPLEDELEPHRWTAELDQLAHKHGILFVCAAGNNGDEDEKLGLHRVQVPADMINGISVGACTSKAKSPPERALYSACGPGRPGQGVQPTGVGFGGSDDEPFIGIDRRGKLTRANGTSFASPLSARGIVGLSSRLSQGQRTPETLRAFSVHFARRRGRKHSLDELGYGRFQEDYEGVMECSQNECSILYEDQLRRGDTIALRIPIPSGLRSNENIQLSWTISFLSETDPTEALEYSKSGLDIAFRPHELMRSLTNRKTKKSREMNIETEESEIKQMVASGDWIMGDHPPTESNWRQYKAEMARRKAGKWETIIRGKCRKAYTKFHNPRLDISYLFREKGRLIEPKALVTPLKFSAVVTVKGPKGTNVYDSIKTNYPVLVPLVDVPITVPSTP